MHKPYKCPFEKCNHEAKSLTSLKLHVKSKHHIEALYICPVCKRECKNNDGLRIHTAFHFDDLSHALLFYFLKSSRNISPEWKKVRHKVYRALRSGRIKIRSVQNEESDSN
jgi:hypothetical protein